MTISDIEECVGKKKVVIFGAGEKAEMFWETYHERLNICYFTSNNFCERDFHDLYRVEPNELIQLNNIYIVICVAEAIICSIESQLSMVFNFMEDYIPYTLLEEILEGKKELLLILGVCQQMIIMEGLNSIDSIREKYIIRHYWSMTIKTNMLIKKEVEMLSQYAKYIIILKTDAYQDYLYDSENIKLIKMPYLVMPVIFPQISWAIDMGIMYLYNPKMLQRAKRHVSDIRAFRYTDRNVVEMLKRGLNEKEILKEISREDFYSKEDLMDMLKKMKYYNNKNEDGSDVYLAEYIMEHYKQEKLFLDGVHYSDSFAWYIVKKIIELMDEKVDFNVIKERGLISELSKEDAVWENECPIYPSVWKNLGLEWVDEKTEYAMVKLHKTEKVSFEEYMINCIKYTKYALGIESLW